MQYISKLLPVTPQYTKWTILMTLLYIALWKILLVLKGIITNVIALKSSIQLDTTSEALEVGSQYPISL